MLSVTMVTKLVFLLALFGVASSTLPNIQICDPEEKRETPTLCSNYENILHLDNIQTNFEDKQIMLEQRINAMEGRTRLQLESANSNINALKTLVNNLSSALERTKIQMELEFKDTNTQVEKNKVDIASLKTEVQELVKHREMAVGNFSVIEKILKTTERQLREKNAMLENLETATEAAFMETQRLLNLYKNELSQLNTTAQKLEVKVEARLYATKTELEAKLKTIQNKNDAFSAKLNEQKAEVVNFKVNTDNKFRNLDQQLTTQKTTVDQQKADIDTLKSDTAVSAKVAFAASIIEYEAFTGPYTPNTNRIMIFNKVFTNIGNAYNNQTGLFTAPVAGVYHFSYSTFGYNAYTSGAILVKNGHYQVSTWEFTGPDMSDMTSNTVILDLNVKETVNIILWEGGKIHTGVFSGFLVFPSS